MKRGFKMNRFIPKNKLSKKAKRAFDQAQRNIWPISPVTRKAQSKKAYNRKKTRQERDDSFPNGSFLYDRQSAFLSEQKIDYSNYKKSDAYQTGDHDCGITPSETRWGDMSDNNT